MAGEIKLERVVRTNTRSSRIERRADHPHEGRSEVVDIGKRGRATVEPRNIVASGGNTSPYRRGATPSESRIGSIVVDTNEEELRKRFGGSDAYFLRPVSDRDEIRHNYMTVSGAERLARHVNKFDRFYNHDVVINVYGHLDVFSGDVIRALMWPLADYTIDFAVVVEDWDGPSRDDETIGVTVEWAERRHVHRLVGCQVGRPTEFSHDPGALGAPLSAAVACLCVQASILGSVSAFRAQLARTGGVARAASRVRHGNADRGRAARGTHRVGGAGTDSAS